VKDHKSLKVWQEARLVTLGVLELCRGSWQPWGAAVFSQLQRASLSVQLNIAEGYSFGDSPSFTRHLGIAYGSAVETCELLELITAADLAQGDLPGRLLRHVSNTQRLLIGMLRTRRRFC
jgi:four helix bundle protein